MPSSVTPLPSSPDCHTHTQYLDHSQSISTLYHIRHIRHTYLEGVVLSGKWVVDKETRHLRNPVSEWRESISTSVNIDTNFQVRKRSKNYEIRKFTPSKFSYYTYICMHDLTAKFSIRKLLLYIFIRTVIEESSQPVVHGSAVQTGTDCWRREITHFHLGKDELTGTPFCFQPLS